MPVDLISFRIGDGLGKTRAVVFPTAAGHTLADLQTFVTAIAPLLDEIIGGKILDVAVNIGLTLPGGLDANPISGSRNYNGALLSWDVATSEYKTSIFVPTVLAEFFTDDVFDDADTEPAALLAALIAPTGVAVTDKYANALAAFLSGKYVNRK